METRTLLVFLHGSGDAGGVSLSTRLHHIPLPLFHSKTFKELAPLLNMDILLPYSKSLVYAPEFNHVRPAWHNRSANFTDLGRDDVEDENGIDISLDMISEIILRVEAAYDLILIAGFSMGGGMALQFLRHRVSPKIRGICSAGSFLTESSRVFAAPADYSKSATKTSILHSNVQTGIAVATSNEVTSSKKTLYRIEEKEERDDPLKGSDSIQAAESSDEVHEMPTFPNDASQLRKDMKRASSFDLHGGAHLDVLIESSSTVVSHTASLSSASTTRSDASDKHRRLSVFLMHGRDDTTIPPDWGQNTAIQLSETASDRLSVYFKVYDSLGHQINNHELQDLFRWCRHVIHKESPFIHHTRKEAPSTISSSSSSSSITAMDYSIILSASSPPLATADNTSAALLSSIITTSHPTRHLKIYTESQVYNYLRQHAGLCKPMEILVYFKRPKCLHPLTICEFFTKFKYRCKLPPKLRDISPADENTLIDSSNDLSYYRIHIPELRLFRLMCSRELNKDGTTQNTATPTALKHYIVSRGLYHDNVPTLIDPIDLPPGTDVDNVSVGEAVVERQSSLDDSISDSFSVMSLSYPSAEDSSIELHYLRRILLHRPVVSFEDAKTGPDGTVYASFKDAAISFQLT